MLILKCITVESTEVKTEDPIQYTYMKVVNSKIVFDWLSGKYKESVNA